MASATSNLKCICIKTYNDVTCKVFNLPIASVKWKWFAWKQAPLEGSWVEILTLYQRNFQFQALLCASNLLNQNVRPLGLQTFNTQKTHRGKASLLLNGYSVCFADFSCAGSEHADLGGRVCHAAHKAAAARVQHVGCKAVSHLWDASALSVGAFQVCTFDAKFRSATWSTALFPP